MTVQIEDSFVWKKKQYYFENAKDYSSVRLFEPKDYGFIPVAPHTACWKGFVLYFKINEEDELLIDALEINDANNYYPEINNISATYAENIDMVFHIYNNLNLKLSNYSGEIYINSERFIVRLRNKNDKIKNERIKLIIENGKLIDFYLYDGEKEISNEFLKQEFYYLTVTYDDFKDNKKYNYISLDKTIEVGDTVVVDRAGEIVDATVTEVGYYNKFNAPYPLELTKKIIRKLETPTGYNLNNFFYDVHYKLLKDININVEDREYNYDELYSLSDIVIDKELELISTEKDGEYSDLADQYHLLAEMLIDLANDLYENSPDREYYYLSVVFENSDKEYNYMSENTNMKVGDYVLVDCNGKETEARVVKVGYYKANNVPFPLSMTKEIIKKL